MWPNEAWLWPNGEGETEVTEEYLKTREERDSIYLPSRDYETCLDDLPPDKYQRWCELDQKLIRLTAEGHVGVSTVYKDRDMKKSDEKYIDQTSNNLTQALADAYAPRIEDEEAMRICQALRNGTKFTELNLDSIPADLVFSAMLAFHKRQRQTESEQ